ncbi:MAG: histidine triad nucleotide-binding protein [Anaerolineales bacterium]
MNECIFCKIAAGQAAAKIVYRDELATVFWDIHPVAPLHLLLVPNRHLISLNEATAEDAALLGHLVVLAAQMAAQHGVAHSGYRLLTNTGKHGGQSVFHLHWHLLAGRQMRSLG